MRRYHMLKQSRTGKALRWLLILVVSLIYIFPFLWMLSNSFMSESQIFCIPPKFIPDLLFTEHMWDNYRCIFEKWGFGNYLVNSIYVATLAAVGQVIVCTLAGFALAKMNFRGKNTVFAGLMFTLMVPVQVVIIPEYYLFMKLGWMDTYAPLIIPSFLAGSFGTFMMKEFFEQVPSALFDAGIIDGVNAWQMYRRIYLPQAASSISTLFIIAFMNNWNDLLRPMLYISSKPRFTLTIGLANFQTQYDVQWSLLLAGSVVSVLPLILVFCFCQRWIIQNTMNSGIKG